MNYNEMTAAQCADWLEAKDDWIKSVVDGYATWTRKCQPEVAASPHNFRRTPPYPLTLDAAAGALREPWRWDSIEWWDNAVIARYFDAGVRASGFPAFMQRVDGPDELTARYRAAVAARMEEEHEQSR